MVTFCSFYPHSILQAGLPLGTTIDEISRQFAQYGCVRAVQLLGEERGAATAFVEFEKASQAKRAVIEAHNEHSDLIVQSK